MAVENIKVVNTEPYRGPSVGCGFCVYELGSTKRGAEMMPGVERAVA